MKYWISVFMFLCLAVSAHAQDNILSQVTGDTPPAPQDIAPGFSRAMHDFNFFLDKTVVRPPARVYRKIVPAGARRSVGSFFSNLTEPYSAVNNFLQGDTEQGGNNLRRFMVNSLFGVFGLFDVASDMGHAPDYEDLGQTLAVWGVGSGSYIVLPIFGPATVRGAIGRGGDSFLDVASAALVQDYPIEGRVAVQYAILVNERADNMQLLEDLEKNSPDFYETIRAFYWQNRLLEIAK